MKTDFSKVQSVVTRIFLWTSPLAFCVLLVSNFPEVEKSLWENGFFAPVLGPVLALALMAWLFSLLFVLIATFVSARYKERVLQDVVLRRDRDEREELLSGRAAKTSILVTLAASLLILICTTGQYNRAEETDHSSVTIGNFHFSEVAPVVTKLEGGVQVMQYQLPMSKMSLVLLIILIQLSSYHTIKYLNLRKLE
ncbi:MAG: hypothetical protein ACXVA9_03690 [Bdellovibrionales bacterium]